MENKNQKFAQKRDLKSTKKTIRAEGGFTLIELMVTVSLIALLSSLALIAYMSARAKGRDAKRLSDITQMNTALELYFANNRGYPTTSAGLPLALVLYRIQQHLPLCPHINP